MNILSLHPFKSSLFLKGCCAFFLLLVHSTFAQQKLEAYLTIKASKEVSNAVKERKIDSLISALQVTKRDTLLAHSLYDYGRWLYRNSTTEKALVYTLKSASIFETLDTFDEVSYKKTLHNIGFLNGRLGDYFKAYTAYKKLSKFGKKDKYMAEASRNAGRYLVRLGDFYKASEYFENAIALAKEVKDVKTLYKSSVSASINYKQIATQKSFSRGIDILNELIKSIEDEHTGIANQISSQNILKAYNHLANLYNDRDDYDFDKSKENYKKALGIGLDLKDSLSIAYVYSDLGYLYLHDGKKEALTYLNEALKYKPANTATSIIYGNKSAYFLEVKDLEKALYNAQLAVNELSSVSLVDLKELPTKGEMATNKFKYELLESLIEKAEVWSSFHSRTPTDTASLENMLQTLKLADYLVDIIRLESNEQKSKLFWRKIASQVYSNAVKACYYLKKPKEAFYFIEKNKALLLLEDVSSRLQIENAGIPEKVTHRQRYLKKKIMAYSDAMHTNAARDSLRSLLLTTKDTYNNFLDSLENTFNIYYKTQKPATVISLENAQKHVIKENEVFISYILNNKNGYGMMITKETIDFFALPDTNELKNLSKKYIAYLEKPLQTQQEMSAFKKVSNELYSILIPEGIRQHIHNKKISIFADSYLQNIPFEALQTSNQAHSYFIKSNDISYAYSVSFLEQSNHIKRENKNTFLGFAPVNFSQLSNLLESEKEIKFGASQFSSSTFLFDKATKQNFINHIRGSTIIHLASHSNASDGTNPWIAFNDSKLTLDELYLTQNSAELVVLSACETSLGVLNQGEGVMSLSRGFFNTGTNSVLSTLWNVNDKSTSQIIIDFYKQLKKGKTKSEALRLAKLNYLDTHQMSELSPHYWSSFILMGDAGQITLPFNNTLLYTILAAICAGILFLYYQKRKK